MTSKLAHSAHMAKKIAYWLFVKIPFWAVIASLLLVTLLKWVPVRYTPLMLKRSVQHMKDKDFRTRQEWISLDEACPEIIQAVIAAEDNRFCEHRGFDWMEMEKMMESHRKKGKKIRGCSTISQQTAKNVFTFGSRTWARKAFESYWTVLIEKIWGKRRIMEVYLNVAETGPGLYGMEAAALHYYGVHARNLDRKQACSIAACLPSPVERSPERANDFLIRRRAQINSLIPSLSYPDWAR